MSDPNHPVPPDPRADALYRQFREQGIPPTGTAIIVLGDNKCHLCHNSMVNTGYATTAGRNNVPVRWVNFYGDQESMWKITDNPDFSMDDNGPNGAQRFFINGKAWSGGTPAFVLVQDGRMIDVMYAGELHNVNELNDLGNEASMRAAARAAAPQTSSITPTSGEPTALAFNAVNRSAGAERPA